MIDPTKKFLNDLFLLSPVLADTHKETLEYWHPEPPPVTIAYAEIGKAIVDQIDAMREDTRRGVFDLIEDGVKSSNQDLGVAVATGLLEALVGRACRKDTGSRILKELGPQAQAHARAWLNA